MRIRREPTDDEISRRAYEIWEQRTGGAPRSSNGVREAALDDWLEAKAQLQAAEVAAESTDGALDAGEADDDRRYDRREIVIRSDGT